MKVKKAGFGVAALAMLAFGAGSSPLYAEAIERPDTGSIALNELVRAYDEIRALKELVILLNSNRNLQRALIELFEQRASAVSARRIGRLGQRELLATLKPGQRISLFSFCAVLRSFTSDSLGNNMQVKWTWPGQALSEEKVTFLSGDDGELKFECGGRTQ